MIKDEKKYRILVIEDNPGDFLIVEDLLTEQILNPAIVHAKNYKEAVVLLAAKDNPFDIILLDLTLPDKSGQELINEIILAAPNYPIIILTGYTDVDFSIRSITRNISDYLLKDDLNATTLYKSILYAIERNKYIAEIRKSEKRYSDLFRLSPQPKLVFDVETYQLVQVNNAAANRYGYSEQEFLGLSLRDITQEEDIPKIKEVLAANIDQEKVNQIGIRFTHRKKNGELMEVETYSTPILIGEKQCRSMIAIDITEKLLHEERVIQAILKTQDEERYEVGSELHDNVCQILAASQIGLDKLEEVIPAEKMNWFSYCKDQLSLALIEIRNLSHRMAPTFYNDTTVEFSFRKLLRSFDIESKYSINLTIDETVQQYRISTDAQLYLYRILQEQLRNISKYAHASEILIDVFVTDNQFKMTITDNGVGFATDTIMEGIGIANMRRRAEFFSGTLHISSAAGKGCRVSVEIPLNKIMVP
ncbi:MAG TPA: PAS domain S-box protein [Sediminibacterium sp.]